MTNPTGDALAANARVSLTPEDRVAFATAAAWLREQALACGMCEAIANSHPSQPYVIEKRLKALLADVYRPAFCRSDLWAGRLTPENHAARIDALEALADDNPAEIARCRDIFERNAREGT